MRAVPGLYVHVDCDCTVRESPAAMKWKIEWWGQSGRRQQLPVCLFFNTTVGETFKPDFFHLPCNEAGIKGPSDSEKVSLLGRPRPFLVRVNRKFLFIWAVDYCDKV